MKLPFFLAMIPLCHSMRYIRVDDILCIDQIHVNRFSLINAIAEEKILNHMETNNNNM